MGTGTESTAPIKRKRIDFVFSDVDGTLVHYPTVKTSLDEKTQNNNDDDNDLVWLPPSATGRRGVISKQTIFKCLEIRKRLSTIFVLVSGMRTTTLFHRIPYLPPADAYCSEGGGRIFYPRLFQGDDDQGSLHKLEGIVCKPNSNEPQSFTSILASQNDDENDSLNTPFFLVEDLDWRERMLQYCGNKDENETIHQVAEDSATKSKETDMEKNQDNNVLLWDYARILQQQGFVIDSKGYLTSFRVNRKQQHQDKPHAKELFDTLSKQSPPNGLASSVNLGCIDCYPNTSGKKNCCEYVAAKLGPQENNFDSTLSQSAFCICDDDNDLEMALACQHAFIPGVSSQSMFDVIGQHAQHFTVTADDKEKADNPSVGPRATERALDQVIAKLEGSA